ncbi:unnamed protein product [Closterium sp. NIES-54]
MVEPSSTTDENHCEMERPEHLTVNTVNNISNSSNNNYGNNAFLQSVSEIHTPLSKRETNSDIHYRPSAFASSLRDTTNHKFHPGSAVHHGSYGTPFTGTRGGTPFTGARGGAKMRQSPAVQRKEVLQLMEERDEAQRAAKAIFEEKRDLEAVHERLLEEYEEKEMELEEAMAARDAEVNRRKQLENALAVAEGKDGDGWRRLQREQQLQEQVQALRRETAGLKRQVEEAKWREEETKEKLKECQNKLEQVRSFINIWRSVSTRAAPPLLLSNSQHAVPLQAAAWRRKWEAAERELGEARQEMARLEVWQL